MSTETQEEPRKGRSNAILTYEEINNIHLGIQKLDLGMQRLEEKLDDVAAQHIDHEVRIRALELVTARQGATTGFAKWAGPFLISVAGIVLAIVSYLKPH